MHLDLEIIRASRRQHNLHPPVLESLVRSTPHNTTCHFGHLIYSNSSTATLGNSSRQNLTLALGSYHVLYQSRLRRVNTRFKSKDYHSVSYVCPENIVCENAKAHRRPPNSCVLLRRSAEERKTRHLTQKPSNAKLQTRLRHKHQLTDTYVLNSFSTLSLHIHEQPLLASQLRALTEIVQCSKPKANPAKVLCQGVAGELVSVAVDAEDEAVAREVGLFGEFEEGHKTIYC
jgi:hypothetical protein